MKGLIGRKVGMTQLFRPTGERIAVTVLQVGPCVVTQQRTLDHDGYEALQLAFEPVLDDEKGKDLSPEQRERLLTKRVRKPQRGHFDKAGAAPHRVLREVRCEAAEETPVGAVLTAGIFASGERVDVVGTSKGRGFAGVMRRHGFHGHKASHGAKIHRTPASIGATDAARVFPGQRMAGQMGRERVTSRNLVVEMVDPAANVIAVRGAVPGPRGGLVMVLGAGEFPEEEAPAAGGGAVSLLQIAAHAFCTRDRSFLRRLMANEPEARATFENWVAEELQTLSSEFQESDRSGLDQWLEGQGFAPEERATLIRTAIEGL